MKKTRILALALCVALSCALVVPASAASMTFTDVEGHWALSYIRDMTEAGMFTGYDDGTFRPDVSMQRVEGFALCARVTQPSDVRLQIAADQSARLHKLFPDLPENWWFFKEAATCDALGIESLENLADLYYSGALTRPTQQPGMTAGELARGDMTKAEFAMYLVRGMGLEDLARSLDADELPFDDELFIADKYRPYVKLLYSYGVLTGDENNNFNPDQSLTRAVCATMLSRSIEHIVKEKKVSVELPQYTKYAWTSGTIVDVDVVEDGMRLLKLRSEITGEETVILAPTTKVYQYNKEDQFTALKTGAFAKVCYAANGTTVDAVRVTPADLVETVVGDCGKDLTTTSVIIDGVPYEIDRFTQVSAGGKTGDRSIIDYAANYTDAEAGVNSQGKLLWLKLSGGTRLVEGILTDVTTQTVGTGERTTITVKGYNGVATTYTVPAGTVVTVNGDLSSLRESQEGRQVILRVADANLSEIKAVEVNMIDRYLQGVLRNLDVKTDPKRVEIRVEGDSKSTRYEVSDDCAVTYRGAATELAKLSLNSFVTAKIEGGTVTGLMAWQGYEDTEGTLTGITPGSNATVLEVTREDGTVVRFNIPLEQLSSVSFTTNGKDGDVTQLRTGDHVVVTVLYNDVTQVDYTPQSANVTGTLDSITRKGDGTAELTVIFADGSKHTYTATAATTVTQGGKPVSMSSVNPNSPVSLVAEGDRAISVEVTGTAVMSTELSGVIYNIDPQARIATLVVNENGENRLVNVHIPSGVTILDVTTGNTLTNISRLSVRNTITAFGSYGSDGTFEATSVVRK